MMPDTRQDYDLQKYPHDTSCFHCGMSVPAEPDHIVEIEGVPRSMCCSGCAATARAIVDSGLDAYYHNRTATPQQGPALESLGDSQVFDHPQIQRGLVSEKTGTLRETSLILEGITCAACMWLNEQHLAKLPGVHKVSVNYSTRRAQVCWDNSQIKLSHILDEVKRIGYVAHPYDPGRRQQVLETERKRLLQRLGVAGVLGMQVMVLAVALYSGAWYGIEPKFEQFFQRVSLILTLPILVYSAQPFLLGAWRDISNRRVGMDVPVSLGISLAFIASVWTTVMGEGHVYYDSVAMFVFFLLSARYLELGARKRAADQVDEIARTIPASATRLDVVAGRRTETVIPAVELKLGDLVLVRAGESIPADGEVLEGSSTVDESLWTGESVPEARHIGQALVGGSINVESPLVMRITGTGADTVLAGIERLVERAQAEKPKVARLADQVAGWFVSLVLCLAACVALLWWHFDHARWLPITVAVLVVSCPCALSLATPTAIAAAIQNLLRHGVLTARSDALETLARATHFVFDKTGTLTEGKLSVSAVYPLSNRSAAECVGLAAALERYSEHPIAKALVQNVQGNDLPDAIEVHNTPGLGLRGTIDSEPFVIGKVEYVCEQTGWSLPEQTLFELEQAGSTIVLLANHQGLLCAFCVEDSIRNESAGLVRNLKDLGKVVVLSTGDRESAARSLAQRLQIEEIYANMTPTEKLEQVRKLQADGAIVAMVGDGINDAPVLAEAQVSAAVAGVAPLAEATADLVLLSKRLSDFWHAVKTSKRTRRVIQQNLLWAIGYNAIAIPFAALGYVPPWLAALGMSMSSLVVVLNASRLMGPSTQRA